MELSRDRDVRIAHSRDASGLELLPDAVARPADRREVAEIVREAMRTKTHVTPAGSQTSMTGASITDSGILLSMSGMRRILDVDTSARTARVHPGVTIGDLNRELRETGLHFAPDPTSENDATVGGAIACNASGARSLRHGPARRHVLGLDVVTAGGDSLSYARTLLDKNTVGFAGVQDPVDWYIGSEGTLGIIVEARLSLVTLPVNLTGLAIPFADSASALAFVVSARQHAARSAHCLEFFDGEALAIAGAAMRRPWSDAAHAMVYLEDDAGEEAMETMLDPWLELAERHAAIAGDIRAFDSSQSLREAREMRHAVPATMNERGERYRSAGGRKVSTDWSVPYPRLSEALDISRDASVRHEAPQPVTYGHAGNGHPHQNYIADDARSVERINAAIEETLQSVFAMGGTFSAEHGLGKLKKRWLGLQLGPQQIEVMRAMKRALDPDGLLSPGNVL